MRMTAKEIRAECENALAQGWIKANVEYAPKMRAAMSRKPVRAAVMLAAMLPMMTQTAFATTGGADIAARLDNAGKDIYSFIRGLVTTFGVVALAACGIVLLLGIGGQRASENAKAWMFRIAVGIALVYLAEPLIKWVEGIADPSAGTTP